MITASEMREFQRDAESLMTLTFAAYAPGATVTDADGATSVADVLKGTTIGKVQGTSAVGKDPVTRTVSVGGVPLPVVDGGLHIPVGALTAADGSLALVAGVKGTGWEMECTAVGRADDKALVGRRYLVVSAPAKSRATARRLDVVELPPPPEPPAEED